MATQLHPLLMGALYDATFLDGGATVEISDDGQVDIPETGYVVSVTAMDFTAQADEDPSKFFDVMVDVLTDFNPPALGVWREPGTNTIFVDPVEIYELQADAMAAAYARGEIAVYDLSTQTTLHVSADAAGYEGYED